ncbi:MAG: alpha/beta hydrolase [Desulfobacterota bacterium]|nr:alpha/beta hydrolase [Thermodesulfobacteriota bacterium]
MGTCRKSALYLCAASIFLSQFFFPHRATPASLDNSLATHLNNLRFHTGEASIYYETYMRLSSRLMQDIPTAAEKETITTDLVRVAGMVRHHTSECLAALDQIDTALKASGADPVLNTRVQHLRKRLTEKVDRFIQHCQSGNLDNFPFRRKRHDNARFQSDGLTNERISAIVRPAVLHDVEEDAIGRHPLNTLSGITNNAFIPPKSDDLHEDGVDVVFTDAIRALAQRLDHDPIRIYEYVRDHITYQPYWGSLKGARGTLAEGSGNDTDTASLLIALLRVSGYPARYGEARVILDIERAKNWLGLNDNRQVGYYLATAGIPDVEELYRAGQIVQIRFKHIFVEAYMPYGDYRGQQRSSLHPLWVPLAPAFKTMRHIAGKFCPEQLQFNSATFIQQLTAGATIQPDGGLAGLNTEVITTTLDSYRNLLENVIEKENPQMTLRELFGYSEIHPCHDPILPITLPFAAEPAIRYSKIPELMHHRIKIQLSYWGTDLDADEEEGGLGTQEIRYMTPTANVVGRRLTLSYRPATPADKDLLQRYDGNLFGIPCFLIHMYPQLTLDGVVVAENEHKEREGVIDNAAISLGLDENIRIELYKPGETVFPQRRSDTLVTVGDYMTIVIDCGRIATDYVHASMQRHKKALAETAADVEPLIGEQLFQTGCGYFYQYDAIVDSIAQQAGVQWFRNPSELTVSRHLQVSWLMDYFPVAIESTTILLDVTGNRIQAIPKTDAWNRREAFLRIATQYSSIMEHTILNEFYHQHAVSAISLIQTALDQHMPIYEITSQNRSELMKHIKLPREDIAVINRELTLGQIVIVPQQQLTVNQYTGTPIISLTPPGNATGSFREGFFISRCKPKPYSLKPADGGQITEAISDILNDLVAPDHHSWLTFETTAQNALLNVMTNSDSIRDGTMPVRSFLNSATGMILSLLVMQQQSTASSMLLTGCSMMSLSLRSIGEFLKDTLVMYIDFESDPIYCPEKNNGVRSAQYMVMDMLGQPKPGCQPSGTITHETTKPLDAVTQSGADGVGTFTFSYDNSTQFSPGDLLEVVLALPLPTGGQVTTRGTFRVNGIDLDIDSNNNQWLHDPARTIEEERIENHEGSPEYPGKIIPLNNGDMDGDGVPDFADGINLFGNDGSDAGGNLVPMILEIPPSADPAIIEIRFSYNQSNPADIIRNGEGTNDNPYRYTVTEGRLRIWTVDGTQSRNVSEPGAAGGHFVKSGSVYTASQLGTGHAIRLFVEGVNPSLAPGDEIILVESRQRGSAEGWVMRDEIRVTVLDIGIDPDYNRDGVIDELDRGRVSIKRPWRFWINDDDDGDADPERGINDDTDDQLGLAVPDDLPGQREDNTDDHVNGIRDLLDFFPLRLRLQQALNFFPPDRYAYSLEHEAGTIGILCTYAAPSDAAHRYLTDPDEALKLCRKQVVKIGAETDRFTIPDSVLVAMLEAPPTDVLLFEARSLSDKPLRLCIQSKTDGKTVYMQEFPLELLDVREMYYHANFRNVGCPDGKNCGGDIERLERIKKPFCMDDNSTALVWVHGYNVNGNAATATFAEVFKRFYHTGFNGSFYGVSWYSNPPVSFTTKPLPPHYHQAVVNAFNMAEPLATFINQIVRRKSNTVSVAAHSLGNVMVSAAIQDYGLQVDNYFAVDAAVALEAYGQNYDEDHSMIKVDKWKTYYDYDCWHDNQTGQKKLLSSEWYTLFEGTNDNRKLLTWRNRFKDVVSPNMYNFYSSTEEVLATYHGDNMIFDGSWSCFADKAWVKQEKFKGRAGALIINAGGVESPFAGWGFNENHSHYNRKPEDLGILDNVFIENLKRKPFFRAEPFELFDSRSGSTFVMRNAGQTSLKDYYKNLDARHVPVRDWLLAEAFPATSLAMGGNFTKAVRESQNINLSSIGDKGIITEGFLCQWPRKINLNDNYINQWFHSDYKDVSYQHVNKFFKRIVGLCR